MKKSSHRANSQRLTPQEQLLILSFLDDHLSRAEKGLKTAIEALKIAPTSPQFIGMAEHFTRLTSVITDMSTHIEGRQRWVPGYRAAAAMVEAEPCPSPT